MGNFHTHLNYLSRINLNKSTKTSISLCVGTVSSVAIFLSILRRKYSTKNNLSYIEYSKNKDIESKDVEKISVLQFNILARNLATPSHFPYVLPHILEWEHRKKILIKQILEANADILCLEELTDYWTYFKEILYSHGYDSVYVKRPSVHVSNWSGEKKQDGCAIFFKMSKIKLNECESINFHDVHDRVALLALLELCDSNRKVLVAATHLWWNHTKPDHQIEELKELEREIISLEDHIRKKYSKEIKNSLCPKNNLPIILCGDFNNSPSSPIYEYLSNSFMKSGKRKRFRSAYDMYLKYDQIDKTKANNLTDIFEPQHTTVNFRRCWTIDYIWYCTNCFTVSKVLKIPSEEDLRSEEGPPNWLALTMDDVRGRLPAGLHGNHNGIPNSKHGSDHVPLVAELIFNCTYNNTSI